MVFDHRLRDIADLVSAFSTPARVGPCMVGAVVFNRRPVHARRGVGRSLDRAAGSGFEVVRTNHRGLYGRRLHARRRQHRHRTAAGLHHSDHAGDTSTGCRGAAIAAGRSASRGSLQSEPSAFWAAADRGSRPVATHRKPQSAECQRGHSTQRRPREPPDRFGRGPPNSARRRRSSCLRWPPEAFRGCRMATWPPSKPLECPESTRTVPWTTRPRSAGFKR